MIENLLHFFNTNTPLCLAFFFALGAAGWMELTKGGAKVTVNELVGMINRDEALVIDVRQPKEYDAGHIDSSINIPLAQVMENLVFIKSKGRTPVLVCENGFSVQGMGEKLSDSGIRVMRLAGGIAEWRVANIPLVKGLHEHAKTKGHKKHHKPKEEKQKQGDKHT